MPSGKALVTFADFSGGEFGLLGDVIAPKGSFTGNNVVRLLDGTLCPRSGLVDLAPSGIPAGVVRGFGVHPYQQKAWVIVGTAVRDFGLSALSPASRSLGSLDAAVSGRIRSVVNVGDSTYITNYGDKVYTLDHGAGTVAGVSGSPGGRVVTLFADRMLVGGTAAHPNRIQYSRWRNYTDWPAAGFIDLGSADYPIVALFGATHQLVAAKTDFSWWTLAGIPPISERWGKVARGLRPGDTTAAPTRWALVGGEDTWFVAEEGDYPVRVAGDKFQRLEHLSLTALTGDYDDTGNTPKVGMAGLAKSEELLAVTGGNDSIYDDQALLFHRGVWTKHAFGKSISGWVDGREDTSRRAIICDGGAAGTAAKFYSWSYDLDRPPFDGKTFESLDDAGVAFTSEFTLPEFVDPKQNEISLVGVVVDFKKWNHGFGGDNTITVEVTPTHRDGSGDGAPQSTTFTEDAAEASVSGTTDSRRLTFANTNFASGFRLKVTGIVGCAIQRLHLFYDTRPVQGI